MQGMPSILIVDDNVTQSETMSSILRRNGYAVTTTENGLEAIERVMERPFDMIFIDIEMHLMNGVETYKRIKKIRPEVLVMMLACPFEEMIQEAVEEGACEVIHKPVDMEKVFAGIEQARKIKEEALISAVV